jgi:hypothetical protein
VAIACLALRNASGAWVSAMLGFALILLTAAVLLAVFRRGSSRAFWIGFAVCGWTYVLVLMYGWNLQPNTMFFNPLKSDELVTSRVSTWAYLKAYPWIAWPTPAGQQVFAGGGMGGLGGGGFGGSSMTSTGGFAFGGGYPGGTAGFGFAGTGPFGGPIQQDFVNVAHALWTLLIALCGGWFARWAYASGPGSGASFNPQPEAKGDRKEHSDDR